ncbi:hypothetical protein KP509_29G001400 [Ceratopteris richardii]|nr:hypothetical protein KP509_29G001400 [Ceratopteris richardii]
MSPTDNSDSNNYSAVVSPSDETTEEKPVPENSGESGSTLKEHDYIGMAEVSSASLEKSECQQELSLNETELCLGLGLGLMSSKKTEVAEDGEKTISFSFSSQEGMPKTMIDANIVQTYAFLDGVSADKKPLQATWTNLPLRTSASEGGSVSMPPPLQHIRDFQSSQFALSIQEPDSISRAGNCFQAQGAVVHPSTLKNGMKRGYSEAMSDMAKFHVTNDTRNMTVVSGKNGDADTKSLPKQPQTAFLPGWAPPKTTVTAPWHVGIEQSTSHALGNNKAVNVNRMEKAGGADGPPSAYQMTRELAETAQESPSIEAPPPKDRVVGWPPIRSYRKNTLAKPMEMFVKVNMDGVTVGRKVDLNAHHSYEGLLSALEEMFQPSNNAQGSSQVASGNDSKHFRLLNGSDYVLTYEDKDGDWMLVGDVPWSMFVTTVRRLRITRGPDATGPGTKVSEKVK